MYVCMLPGVMASSKTLGPLQLMWLLSSHQGWTPIYLPPPHPLLPPLLMLALLCFIPPCRLNAVCISEDSTLLSGSFCDSIVRVWTLTPRKLFPLKSSSQLQMITLGAGRGYWVTNINMRVNPLSVSFFQPFRVHWKELGLFTNNRYPLKLVWCLN